MSQYFIRALLKRKKERNSMALDKTALTLVIIGALNWLLVGVFQFDLVAAIFGGQTATLSRIVYALVGIAGTWCIGLLFRDWKRVCVVEESAK